MEKALDPAGVIDMSELNNISYVGGTEEIVPNSAVSAVTATISVATAISNFTTNFFSCGQFC